MASNNDTYTYSCLYYLGSESEQEEPVKASGSEDVAQQERQQLMAEINERKRKILREVEVSCALRKLFSNNFYRWP